MNDTTRLVGGTLSVAVAGSVMASIYIDRVVEGFRGSPAPQAAVDASSQSIGAAFFVADQAKATFGEAGSSFVRNLASQAFIDGVRPSMAVMSGVAAVGALIVYALSTKAQHTAEVELEEAGVIV